MGTESLTDLQLSVMKALWAAGEASVSEVSAAMAEEGRVLASTTVATLLQRLGKQGWVTHHKRGRQLVYRARVTRKQAATGMLERVVTSFFGGKASALAAQLLESEHLSGAELEELRQLIKKRGG